MQAEVPYCTICLNKYNLFDFLPKLLVQCGHTVCAHCLNNILKTPDPKCPFDKIRLPFNMNAEQYSTNFALRDLIEDSLKWEKCKEHGQISNLICLEEGQKLCFYCTLGEEHKGHEIKILSDFLREREERKKKFKDILEILNQKEEKLKKIMDEEKKASLQMIRTKFEDAIKILQCQELELSLQVDDIFTQENVKLREKTNVIQQDLLQRISDCDNYQREKVNLSNIDEEVITSTLATREESLNKVIKELHKGLDQTFIHMGNSLNGLERSIKEDFFMELNNESLQSAKDDVPRDLNLSFKFIDSISSLEFEHKDGILSIKNMEFFKKSTNDILLSEVNEVEIQIGETSFTEKNLVILNCIWNKKLKHVESVSIITNSKKISEENVIALLPIIFHRPEHLKKIKVDLEFINIGDNSVRWITEAISKTSKLQSFILYLRKANITDVTVQALSEGLSKLKLTTLRIYLGGTKATATSIQKMFINMPSVKNFAYSLGGIKLNDDDLELFINNMMITMENVEIFELYLWETLVTDKGIVRVLNNLKNVVEVTLDVSNTNITDESFNEFFETVLPRMKSLKKLVVHAKGSKVTTQISDKLAMINDQYNMNQNS